MAEIKRVRLHADMRHAVRAVDHISMCQRIASQASELAARAQRDASLADSLLGQLNHLSMYANMAADVAEVSIGASAPAPIEDAPATMDRLLVELAGLLVMFREPGKLTKQRVQAIVEQVAVVAEASLAWQRRLATRTVWERELQTQVAILRTPERNLAAGSAVAVRVLPQVIREVAGKRSLSPPEEELDRLAAAAPTDAAPRSPAGREPAAASAPPADAAPSSLAGGEPASKVDRALFPVANQPAAC